MEQLGPDEIDMNYDTPARKDEEVEDIVDYFPYKEGVTDVALVVEGKKLFVSRHTLAYASPVFKSMFFRDFKEKTAKEIRLPDEEYTSFVLFLRNIYPNEYIEINEEDIERILPLVHKYNVSGLKDKCQEWLSNEIDNKLLQSHEHRCYGGGEENINCYFFVKWMYYGSLYELNGLYQKAFDQVIAYEQSTYEGNEFYSSLTDEEKLALLEARIKEIEKSHAERRYYYKYFEHPSGIKIKRPLFKE